MLTKLLGIIWRHAPRGLRRWSTLLTHTRFAATAAAIITNERGQVLLLKHVFRPGTGWGLPGGFLEAGEQPDAALRRELQEEAGLELGGLKLYTVRVFRRPKQIEIVFRSTTTGEGRPMSSEVSEVSWFTLATLPEGLPRDQRELIQRALEDLPQS